MYTTAGKGKRYCNLGNVNGTMYGLCLQNYDGCSMEHGRCFVMEAFHTMPLSCPSRSPVSRTLVVCRMVLLCPSDDNSTTIN